MVGGGTSEEPTYKILTTRTRKVRVQADHYHDWFNLWLQVMEIEDRWRERWDVDIYNDISEAYLRYVEPKGHRYYRLISLRGPLKWRGKISLQNSRE